MTDLIPEQPRHWQYWFRSVFSFDFRSLALYRIFTGLILIWDLIFRAQHFGDMYTEDGLVSRALSHKTYEVLYGPEIANSIWSLYWFSESTEFQIALFVTAMVFAILLTLGCFTRIATIASFVLLASLHTRNPLILSSGDTILKMTLFWSMFLPLGQIWSLDAIRARKSGDRNRTPVSKVKTIASMATAGFMLQVIFMYFFTGVAKLNGDWFSGEAMYYVLRLDIYIREFGKSLLQYDGMLRLVSWATLFVEVIFIWTMLLKWGNGFFRMANLLIYWAFHIGIALSMEIGLFPFICMVIWIPLVPSGIWDRTAAAKQNNIANRRALDQGRLLNWVCAFFIGFFLLWNTFNIDSKTTNAVSRKIGWGAAVRLGYFLHVDQHFQMFGHPPKQNPWFVYEGKLKDGSVIDLMRNEPVDHERPKSVRLSLPGHHWRKFHRNLVHFKYKELRQALADYAVRKWNREHDEEQQVDRLRIICYLEPTGPDYNTSDMKSQVWGFYEDPNRSHSTIFNELDKLGDDIIF